MPTFPPPTPLLLSVVLLHKESVSERLYEHSVCLLFTNNRCLTIKAYDNWKVQSAIIDRRAHDETEFRKAGTKKPPVIISI